MDRIVAANRVASGRVGDGRVSPSRATNGWDGAAFVERAIAPLATALNIHGYLTNPKWHFRSDSEAAELVHQADIEGLRAKWLVELRSRFDADWHARLDQMVAAPEVLRLMLIAELDQAPPPPRDSGAPRWLRIAAITCAALALTAMWLLLGAGPVGPGSRGLALAFLGCFAVALVAEVCRAVLRDRFNCARAAAVHTDLRAALRSVLHRGVAAPVGRVAEMAARLEAASCRE